MKCYMKSWKSLSSPRQRNTMGLTHMNRKMVFWFLRVPTAKITDRYSFQKNCNFVFSEENFHENTTYCLAHCLHVNQLTKSSEVESESAVLHL